MTTSRARVVRRTSQEGARRNVRPDAPNTNYTITHNTLIVNQRHNEICIIAMLCTVGSTLITVKSTLDSYNQRVIAVIFRETLSKHARRSFFKNYFYILYFFFIQKSARRAASQITYRGKHCFLSHPAL